MTMRKDPHADTVSQVDLEIPNMPTQATNHSRFQQVSPASYAQIKSGAAHGLTRSCEILQIYISL